MKVTLNENRLRALVENVVREAFDDAELSSAIKQHGGLKPIDDKILTKDGNILRRGIKDELGDDARNAFTAVNQPSSARGFGNRWTDKDFKGSDIKGAKFVKYLTQDELYHYIQMNNELGLKSAAMSNNALRHGILRTNDGGAIVIDPAYNYETEELRDSRKENSWQLSPKEKFSGMHFSDDDRKALKGNDDSARMTKKGMVNPIEKNAAKDIWNRSGVSKIGKDKQEESVNKLKSIVEAQVRKSIKEAFDDPELRDMISQHKGLATKRGFDARDRANDFFTNDLKYSDSDLAGERYPSVDLKTAHVDKKHGIGGYHKDEDGMPSIDGYYDEKDNLITTPRKGFLRTNDGGKIYVSNDQESKDDMLGKVADRIGNQEFSDGISGRHISGARRDLIRNGKRLAKNAKIRSDRKLKAGK